MVTQLPRFLGDSVSESNLNVEKRAEPGISTSGQQSAKMLGNRSLIKEGRREEGNPSTELRRKPDLGLRDPPKIHQPHEALKLPLQPQPHGVKRNPMERFDFKKKLCNVWVKKKSGEVKGGIREGGETQLNFFPEPSRVISVF